MDRNSRNLDVLNDTGNVDYIEMMQGTDMNRTILEEFKNGDPLAFEKIYVRWRKPLYSFLYRLVRSGQDAEDITQDVFTNLWNSRERIDTSKNIKTYIFLLARQSAIRLIYRRQLHGSYLTEYDPIEASHDSHDILVAEQTKLLMEIAVDRMPPRQREIFNFRYKDNLDNEEIARRLGISENNVRQHIHNAKKYIQELLLIMTAVFIS